MKTRRKQNRDKIIEEALKRFDQAESAESENRELWLEDMRFVYDEDGQWPQSAKDAREGRPCMTYDKTSQAVDQIVGDFLKNRPQIKARGFEDGDADVAEIYTGLIRSIENNDQSKRAYKTGFKYAAVGGFGGWRIRHDYVDDESFEQDLLIEPIANPAAMFWDPNAREVTKEDGTYWFLVEKMPKAEFEAQYPKAESTAGDRFQTTGNRSQWFGDEHVMIAEYWRRVAEDSTVYRLEDGRIVNEEDMEALQAVGIQATAERKVKGHRIEWFKITGHEVLEEKEWPSKYYGIVPVFGKNVCLDGKFKYRGIVRKAKDPQRDYNYQRSNYVEATALQAKAPYLATPKMLEGHEKDWREINTKAKPVLFFNFDNGGMPQRQSPPTPASGIVTAFQAASDDIKSATGIYDASLGARSNETSGVAIRERKAEGDTATFEFIDEFTSSMEYTGRILIDMIPKIYDSQRMVRIIGDDETEEVKVINQAIVNPMTGQEEVINDLAMGKYDVVTTGPSYSTKRAETAEQLTQVIAQNPQMGMAIYDIWLKSLDLVGGDEAIKRIRKALIKQGMVEPNEEEQQEMGGQQPDPIEEMVKKLTIETKMEELNGLKIGNMKTQADVLKAQAETQEITKEGQLNEAKAREIMFDMDFDSRTADLFDFRRPSLGG